MNKTLIAVAVSAATLAFGANADMLSTAQANDSNLGGAQLYSKDGNTISLKGRIEARLKTTDRKANDATRARLGLGGVSVINDNLYGLGYVETQYTADDQGNTDGAATQTITIDANTSTITVSNDTVTTRFAYVGVGGKFGQVVYGKTQGSMSQVTDFTDIMWSFGGNTSMKLNASDRPSNDVAYSGAFGDFSVKANYKFVDQNTDSTNTTSVTDNGEDGYSSSLVYNVGATGIKLGAGYENQNKSHKYTAAAGYTIGGLYVGGLYTHGDINYASANGGNYNGSAGFSDVEQYKAYELAASYTMGKTSFTTTYNKAKTDSQDVTNLIGVEAAYAFTSNFRTYLGYQFNLMDEGDTFGTGTVSKAGSSDNAMLGMRYDF